MPTAIENTNAIQEKVLAGIQASQNALVESVRVWAEAVETTFAKLPEVAFSEPPKPGQFLESTFGFTEKVLSSQREFANRLFDAAVPATRAPGAAASTGTATATGKATPPRA